MFNSINKKDKFYLITTTLIVGMCSIVYELLISTTASYFLGNSVKQFSLIIGIYMASMGLGSWISRWINNNLMYYFILTEIILGIIGAFSVPLCYFYFAYTDFQGFNIFIFLIIGIIGLLTGLEIPLLTRIMETNKSLQKSISTVLTFDYLGALIATLIFPFFLVPFVGLYKSSLAFGLINISIGLLTYLVYKSEINKKRSAILLLIIGCAFTLLIGGALFYSQQMLSKWNDQIFRHEVIYEEETPFQNIVMTNNGSFLNLYLNGAIQFSSKDEYRYHEALVHVPMNQIDSVNSVLLLGGGEGLAAREILKYEEVSKLTIVDIDPAITQLSKKMPILRQLNKDALNNPKVEIINEDAFKFLLDSKGSYDIIICDLPDPTNETLARLYSNAFYKNLISKLTKNGVMVTQATSPDLTPNAFWCIDKTLISSGFVKTFPYNINIPSFGNWGFIMAKKNKTIRQEFREGLDLKFLESNMYHHMFYFSKDVRALDVSPNNLDSPILMDYYIDHWQSLQGQKR